MFNQVDFDLDFIDFVENHSVISENIPIIHKVETFEKNEFDLSFKYKK